jgi:hypothetical protein
VLEGKELGGIGNLRFEIADTKGGRKLVTTPIMEMWRRPVVWLFDIMSVPGFESALKLLRIVAPNTGVTARGALLLREVF